jgi:hypothetical protein
MRPGKESISVEAMCFTRLTNDGRDPPSEKNGWNGQVCISPFFASDRERLLKFMAEREHNAFKVILINESDDNPDKITTKDNNKNGRQ